MASGTASQPHPSAPSHGTTRETRRGFLWALLGMVVGAVGGSLGVWVEREGDSTIFPKESFRVRLLGVPIYRELVDAPPDIPSEAARRHPEWSYGHAAAVCVLVASGEGTAKSWAWGLSLTAVCAAIGGIVVWKWRGRAFAVCAAVAVVVALVGILTAKYPIVMASSARP